MFPVRILLGEAGPRTGPPLRSRVREEDGHYGHWGQPLTLRHGVSQEIWGSITMSDLKDKDSPEANLVVSDEIVCTHPLDLGRAKHPADIVDDLDIGSGRLCQIVSLII